MKTGNSFPKRSKPSTVVSSPREHVCAGVSNVGCAKKKLIFTPQHVHVLDGMFGADSHDFSGS